MVEKKKKLVSDRYKLVQGCCEKLVDEQMKITYQLVSERVKIPVKTLQRLPYKQIIAFYRDEGKFCDANKEIVNLKNQISYLNSIIKKLKLENKSLRTELYYNNLN